MGIPRVAYDPARSVGAEYGVHRELSIWRERYLPGGTLKPCPYVGTPRTICSSRKLALF